MLPNCFCVIVLPFILYDFPSIEQSFPNLAVFRVTGERETYRLPILKLVTLPQTQCLRTSDEGWGRFYCRSLGYNLGMADLGLSNTPKSLQNDWTVKERKIVERNRLHLLPEAIRTIFTGSSIFAWLTETLINVFFTPGTQKSRWAFAQEPPNLIFTDCII